MEAIADSILIVLVVLVPLLAIGAVADWLERRYPS